MRPLGRRIGGASAAALLIVLTMADNGQAQGGPPWRDELADDASLQAQCEINRIVSARSSYLDGREIARATIICVDGRKLTASRTDEGVPFKFSACDPQADEGC